MSDLPPARSLAPGEGEEPKASLQKVTRLAEVRSYVSRGS